VLVFQGLRKIVELDFESAASPSSAISALTDNR
jgi:hypothetical protein